MPSSWSSRLGSSASSGAVGPEPVQARELVVVVREPLARAAQQRRRRARRRSPRRGRTARPAGAARRRRCGTRWTPSRTRRSASWSRSARNATVAPSGETRGDQADQARREPPRTAAGAGHDVQVARPQRQPDAVEPPVESLDDARGRLAVGPRRRRSRSERASSATTTKRRPSGCQSNSSTPRAAAT